MGEKLDRILLYLILVVGVPLFLAIMIIAFAGIMIAFLRCMELSELSKNSSISVQASKSRLETIKNTAFSQIKPTYNNVTFATAGINGIGVSYVDDTNPRLLKITVTFCWRQSNRRIIGEDKNLNGVLDVGEDQDGNGKIDSIVQLVSYVFNE